MRTKNFFAIMMLVALCFAGCNQSSEPVINVPSSQEEQDNDYIDLGLPSGVKWKKSNEKMLDSEHLNSSTLANLPTEKEVKELVTNCKWEWGGTGYTVTGFNGNSIWLPAEGYGDHYVGDYGDYWIQKIDGNFAYFHFEHGFTPRISTWKAVERGKMSVRFVKR